MISPLENIKPVLGTLENPIVDSNMTKEEALRPNPEFFLPPEVFEKQILIPIAHFSFDGKYHLGQIVIDKELENDVRDFFHLLLEKKFPIHSMIPVADKKFNFSDEESMAKNNSSCFNPRYIAGTNKLSNHGLGRAVDVNPYQNPYIKDGVVTPAGATYDPTKPGTFIDEDEIVEFLVSRGWRWGGHYKEIKDYHHFEKLLEN